MSEFRISSQAGKRAALILLGYFFVSAIAAICMLTGWLGLRHSPHGAYVIGPILSFATSSLFCIRKIYLIIFANPQGHTPGEHDTAFVIYALILRDYNFAVQNCVEEYGDLFSRIAQLDTSDKDQNEVGFIVTSQVLDILDDVLQERIAYFEGVKPPTDKDAPIKFDRFAHSLPQLQFERRILVEADLSVAQPIAIAVIKDRNRNAVLIGTKSKKTLRGGSPELNRTLFWFGGHVRQDDGAARNADAQRSLVDTLRETLRREIKEELDLDIAVVSNPTICVWDQSSESGRKHIAFVFLIEHDLQSVRIQVDNKEYGINDVKLLSFDEYSRLPNMRVDTWSHSILLNLLKWHAGPLFEQTEFNFVR